MSKQEIITADAYQRLLRLQDEYDQRARRPQGHPEHDLQVACVAWFRATYPADAPMLFAVPNGGSRNRIEAARMKAEGVLRGVADLILLEARGPYGALCIEMKTRSRSSKQSEYQAAWQAATEAAGNRYVIARDYAAFTRAVSVYMALPRRNP